MKGEHVLSGLTLVCVLCLATAVAAPAATPAGRAQAPQPDAPVGTAFTYQGRLIDDDSPADGTYDFEFKLYSGSGYLFGTVYAADVLLMGGYFTAKLDFGAGVFSGLDRWLEIGVRPGDSTGPYTTLTPRQELTPAPYALALPGLYTRENGTSPSVVGGYAGNRVVSGVVGAAIGGGGEASLLNSVTDNYGTVGGGEANQAGSDDGSTGSQPHATVCGGIGNTARADAATVGGGWNNTASGFAAAVGGGYFNAASGKGAAVGGGGPYDPGNPDTTNNRAIDDFSTIGGGAGNVAGSDDGDPESSQYTTVGGGSNNTASGWNATVAGGETNTASGWIATVGGGRSNASSNDFACVGGGFSNTASGAYAAVAAGNDNTAGGDSATVGGGSLNVASGHGSTVPGGVSNLAQGYVSFAAGRRAKANSDGCFVWGDSTDADVTCSTSNRWVARSGGGVYFYTNAGLTSGSYLAAGGNSWSSISDRATKEHLSPADGQAILETLASLPVQEYNLKSQDDSIRHLGMVAQDFAAFGYGESDRAINMEDADGVAMAAIQTLYEKIQALEAENAGLEARVAALEKGFGAGGGSRSWQLGLLPGLGLLAVGLVWAVRRGGGR